MMFITVKLKMHIIENLTNVFSYIFLQNILFQDPKNDFESQFSYNSILQDINVRICAFMIIPSKT